MPFSSIAAAAVIVSARKLRKGLPAGRVLSDIIAAVSGLTVLTASAACIYRRGAPLTSTVIIPRRNIVTAAAVVPRAHRTAAVVRRKSAAAAPAAGAAVVGAAAASQKK